MATTPVLVKPQSQVNIDTGTGPGGVDDQFAGHIAGLAGGGYVIVYSDASRHNSFPPVPNAAFTGAPAGWFQTYNASGEKTNARLLADFIAQNAVTVLPDGNIAVGLGPKGVEIFTPALNLVRTDNTDNRTITVFADGSYAVAYPVGSGSDTDIVGRIVSPTGVVGTQFDIDNQTDNRSSPKLATLSNGNFVAVYQDQFNGSATNTDIRYGIFSPSGAPSQASRVNLCPVLPALGQKWTRTSQR